MGGAYDPSANPDLDNISANYVDRGAEVVVIEIGDVVVATGTLQPEGDGRGRIVRVSVDQAHRRQGLGRQVVEELVSRARRRGMREVVVLTDTPWTSALALYRSWHLWLVAGPVSGGLVAGLLALLYRIESWYQPSPPGPSYDLGAAAIGAAAAGMLGTMAGVAAGLVCAVITAPVEWFGRPSRPLLHMLGVGVTAMLGSSFGVFFMQPGHPLGLGTCCG